MRRRAFDPAETRAVSAVAAGSSANTAQMVAVCPAHSQPFLEGREGKGLMLLDTGTRANEDRRLNWFNRERKDA